MKPASKMELIKALAANHRILKAKPGLLLFLIQYMNKFKILDVGGRFIIHSHLPPINSKAYSRFIDEHLLNPAAGPAHAQVGVTNACPQNCEYCYNKDRKGKAMDTATILQVIRDLKQMGVFWLGFTGGEPLLNKDLVKITESASDDCTVKLFTTGCTLTRERAMELKNAGLVSVSVSLDHWQGEVHDRSRRYAGAFETALKAIRIFREIDGLHVGVSAVLSKEMIQKGQVEAYIEFLIGLGVHEAWLSETKPSVEAFWDDALLITEEERRSLVRLQDRINKEGRITVNYLGHFEGREHFGCNAGRKMVYVDAFGEVSPCVFTPMTFGNVRERPLQEIVAEMRDHFPSENTCFINKNYKLLQKPLGKQVPVSREDSLDILKEVQFGEYARFFQRYY